MENNGNFPILSFGDCTDIHRQ